MGLLAHVTVTPIQKKQKKQNNNHETEDTGHQTLILTNGRSQSGAIILKLNERERNEPKRFTQLSFLLQPMFYRVDRF